MTEKKFEESRLLSLLAKDSQFAFQLLFDRYKDHIYKVATLYVKSPAMAEEIVQDVFLKVWLRRKDLIEIECFESWLYVVSKNLILNYNKRIALEWRACRTYQAQEISAGNDTDYKIREDQYYGLLQNAISELPPQQQVVYRMAKQENRSYEEIAKRLNISSFTVKTHMARALNSIRSFLKRHSGIISFLTVIMILR